jgi:hypothetical protein
MVAVGKKDRSIRHDGVEICRGRRAARKGRHGPATAEDPRQVLVRGRVIAHASQVLAARGEIGKTAPDAFQSALDGMNMRVHKPRRKQSTLQVDDDGSRSIHLGRHLNDTAVPNENLPGTEVRVTVEHRSIDKRGGVQRLKHSFSSIG